MCLILMIAHLTQRPSDLIVRRTDASFAGIIQNADSQTLSCADISTRDQNHSSFSNKSRASVRFHVHVMTRTATKPAQRSKLRNYGLKIHCRSMTKPNGQKNVITDRLVTFKAEAKQKRTFQLDNYSGKTRSHLLQLCGNTCFS